MNAQKTSATDNALLESLLPQETSTVRQLFNTEGLRAPEIIWSPQETELVSPQHRQFAKRVSQTLNSAGYLQQGRFAIADFERFSDWLIHLAVEEDGAAFRYLYYGSAVSETAGTDMTGLTSGEHGGYTQVFLTTLYRATLTVRTPVYSYHESPREMFTRGWHRLIYPVVDATDQIVEFLVMGVPDNELSVGLELLSDPVFVVSASHGVAYCNRAARAYFDLPRIVQRDAPFSTLTGFDLDVRRSPEALLSEGSTVTFPELIDRGGLMERLDVTVSSAEHRRQAFYVVVMRPSTS